MTEYIKFLFTNDILCFFLICILLVGTYLQKNRKEKPAKYFCFMLYSCLIHFTINFLSELFDGHPDCRVLTTLLNLFTFFSIDFVLITFSLYLFSLIEEENGKYIHLINIPILTCLFRILITIILFFLGYLFIIDDNGCYIEKECISVPYYISLLAIVELITFLLINRKHFSTRKLLVMLLYEILPAIAAFAELLFDTYPLTNIAIVLSITLVYVVIQNTIIEKSKTRELILEELSNKDLLTKLQNRRSYYTRMNNIDKDKNIGLLFCDINGLKYTNDHFGHAAGDDLITKFSTLLTKTFGIQNCYRISGDEFVVIIQENNPNVLLSLVTSFRSIIRMNNNIAAIGFSYGKGMMIEHLVSEAEEKMYQDKEANHRINPWIERDKGSSSI